MTMSVWCSAVIVFIGEREKTRAPQPFEVKSSTMTKEDISSACSAIHCCYRAPCCHQDRVHRQHLDQQYQAFALAVLCLGRFWFQAKTQELNKTLLHQLQETLLQLSILQKSTLSSANQAPSFTDTVISHSSSVPSRLTWLWVFDTVLSQSS